MDVDFRKAAELLKQGKIGVIPTDTVYGLVCIAKSAQSVKRLYAAKKRENKPGTVIAADAEQLEDLGHQLWYVLWMMPSRCYGKGRLILNLIMS
jgi:tRNA A37 threonylcarbamoyladenosine synthetase subunit TsaC/SUA5/YrdC